MFYGMAELRILLGYFRLILTIRLDKFLHHPLNIYSRSALRFVKNAILNISEDFIG